MNPELQTQSISNISKLYEQDFYLWLQTTATLLKEKQLELVDFDSLIEEIESMGRSEKKELKSRFTILIEHLLKLNIGKLKKLIMLEDGVKLLLNKEGRLNIY
jgi:hypothetical protein